MAVLFSILGVIALAIGIFGKKFGVADLDGFDLGRPASTWSGRVVFLGGGLFFIVIGLHYILFDQ
jgi:hypothetical protein